VPNEVLAEIFSYIPMEKTVEWSENGKEKKLVQFVVLLRICRAFRTAAFESSELLDWDFDFSSLIAGCNPDWADPRTTYRIARFLRTLFADEYLVRALTRKREWTLKEPLVGAIPIIHRSIEMVSVECNDVTEAVLERLSICQFITELAVNLRRSSPVSLNLDRISEWFPLLQYLKITLPQNVRGSLNALRHLISLEINKVAELDHYPDDLDHYRDECPDSDRGFGAFLLPYESAETLSSLRMQAPVVNLAKVDISPFHNLEHVTVILDYDLVQVVQDITQFLGRLDALLETFECRIQGVPDAKIFRLPSLTYLQDLTIYALGGLNYYDEVKHDYITACANLLMEITENLRYLREILFVDVGIDVGNVQCLSRLRNLKSITWMFEDPNPGFGEDSYECLVRGDGLPEEALAKAFESFEVKPKIEIVRCGDFYDTLRPRWPCRYWVF
jgi:hypothetical protein